MHSFYTSWKRIPLFFPALLTIMFSQAQLTTKQQAQDLLRKNSRTCGLSATAVNEYIVTDAYPDRISGEFLVYVQQTYLGIPVYNKIGVYSFKKDTLVAKTTNFIPRIAAVADARAVFGARAVFSVNPEQAIRSAANHLSIPSGQEPRVMIKDMLHQRFVYSPSGVSRRNISSDLVWLPSKDGAVVKLAWNVRIATPDGNSDYYVRVDAQTGEVLEKSSLIVSERNTKDCVEMASDEKVGAKWVLKGAAAPVAPAAPVAGEAGTATAGEAAAFGTPTASSVSYRVYPFPLESANYGSRVLDVNPWLRAGSGNNAGTLGWQYDNVTNFLFTRGNNVWAQQDIDGSSTTVGYADTSSTGTPTLTFDRPIDASLAPTSYSNIRAAMDNLFYWNNIMHDISYQYGFDEVAGNFQADNQGRGGIGNDYVNAFAEDGAGLNNADFATPPDGENPRMRMFQWTSAVVPKFHVNSPAGIAADYTAPEDLFSNMNRLPGSGPVTADIVYVVDAPGGTHLGCSAGFSNSLVGKIALIDRGSCSFAIKVKAAQTAGALGVIVVNNAGGAPLTMTGTDNTITIPAMMVSDVDGATLKNNLTGLNATISATGQMRDGALDNGVMAHEYTHGISNRLTAGPANSDCLFNAEQMGEGWSDYMALMVTTDWSTAAVTDGPKARPLGTYVEAQPTTGTGIRTYPYSTDMGINPWTYGMLATNTGGEVHTVGEIWCATLWDMTWNIIQQEGIDPDIYHGVKGNNKALQLVIQGLKYQPCSPGFLDGRDAILKADSVLYGYAHKCAIWNAFARRGMGKSASQGSSFSYQDQTAATDLPMKLDIAQTIDKTSLGKGDNITYTISATCDCTPLSNISVVDTLSANLSYISSSGGSYTAPYVHFDGNNFAAGETKTFMVAASVSGTYAFPDTLVNDDADAHAYPWAAAATIGSASFGLTTVRSHSATHSWHTPDLTTSTDLTLTSGNLLLDTLSVLSFWHYFETDASYDGGVLEISTDGGSTWKDLGPYMTQNPYNSNLSALTPGTVNRLGFSGSTGGSFIQTVVSLTGFAGSTAKIRFRFASDNLPSDNPASDEGWYIDDILLQNTKGAVSLTNAFSSGGSLLASTNTVSLFAPVALPVNFVSFDAKKQNKTAFLHWVVSGEVNVSKYIVQRSTDGQHFSAIGEVTAVLAGSGGTEDYTFTDAQPVDGNDFYRIVEQDLDGRTTMSITKLLTFNNNSLAIRLSPVPTYTHQVQLEITTDTDVPMSACLINMVGQTLKVFVVRPGTNQLSLENFAKGMYFLKIQAGANDTEIRKIVIQ